MLKAPCVEHYAMLPNIPDSEVPGAIMGPTWVLSAPDGPHVGPGTLLSGMVCTSLIIMITLLAIIARKQRECLIKYNMFAVELNISLDGFMAWQSCRHYGHLSGKSTGHRWSPLKSQQRRALKFCLLLASTRCWTNKNRVAVDIKRIDSPSGRCWRKCNEYILLFRMYCERLRNDHL